MLEQINHKITDNLLLFLPSLPAARFEDHWHKTELSEAWRVSEEQGKEELRRRRRSNRGLESE